MNKAHYKQVCQLVNEYKLDSKEFENTYHVVINNDGSIYDYYQRMVFDTLVTWARSVQNLQ